MRNQALQVGMRRSAGKDKPVSGGVESWKSLELSGDGIERTEEKAVHIQEFWSSHLFTVALNMLLNSMPGIQTLKSCHLLETG